MDTDETAAIATPRRRLAVGAAIVLVLGAFAVTVVIGIARTAAAPVQTLPLASSQPEAPIAAQLYVHVSGAVAAPGLYVLREGARVVDAVGAAGGFAADADRAGVNLARAVKDGEQLRVPRAGEAAPPGATVEDAPIDLNTADAAALDTLPRIGPALAQRIIEWRESHGPFTAVEDLLAIPGFGEKLVEALRERVSV